MNPRIHVASPYTTALLPRFLELVAAPGPKLIALSGGRTPREFFALLAGQHRDQIPWNRIEFFQVDERCVPVDHADSNWRQIKETILDHVPQAHAHYMNPMQREGDGYYDDLLLKKMPLAPGGIPIFDLVLLGLGADGHTASLFPDTAALEETRLNVTYNSVPQLNTTRMTLTFPVLNAARHRWFIVRGADRREVFREVLAGRHPAGRIRDPEWFVEPDVVGGGS